MAGLLALDHRIWLFFLRKRGLSFCVRVLPWHGFQYLYSGLAFAIGALTSVAGGVESRPAVAAERVG
ncbi:MAG: hypothetical protein O2923_02595 [Verrucomicrobia bacterium]|nr:hypothetical protein [Verrucomicrobiota bacterium]MDA1086130.1 hypothetical protein [Verrucomicrobiota bacterium]